MWSPGCRGLFEGSLPASSGSMGTMEDGWLAAHHPLCWSSQALCNLPLLRLMTNPESGSIMVAGGWTHSPVTSAVHLDCTPSCRRFQYVDEPCRQTFTSQTQTHGEGVDQQRHRITKEGHQITTCSFCKVEHVERTTIFHVCQSW